MSYDILKALIEGDEVYLYKVRLAGMLKRMPKYTEKNMNCEKMYGFRIISIVFILLFSSFPSSLIID